MNSGEKRGKGMVVTFHLRNEAREDYDGCVFPACFRLNFGHNFREIKSVFTKLTLAREKRTR